MDNSSKTRIGWNALQQKLKLKFALLTDDDVLLDEGKYEELLCRLQVRLGKTRAEIHVILSSL